MLTKDDLKALRSAERIAFDHIPAFGGSGQIRCFKEITNGPFTSEAEHKIVLASYQGYASCYSSAENGDFRAYYYATSARYSPELQTILSFLKEGDELSLIWGENGNDYCHQAGLYLDQLVLRVTRKGKSYSFLVAVSICPNNSARMIKHF